MELRADMTHGMGSPESNPKLLRVEPGKVECPELVQTRPASCFVEGAHALILRVSCYCGLAPLRIESRSNGFSVSISKAMCIYSYILVTILVLCAVLGLAGELIAGEESARMTSRMSQVVSSCDGLVVVVTAGAGVYGAPGRMKNMLAFMGSVAMVDCSIGTKYCKSTERKLCTLLLCILVFFSALLADDLCYYVMEGKRNGRQWNVFVNYLAFYLLWFVVMTLELQFTVTALAVRARFLALNDALALTTSRLSVSLEESPPTLSMDAVHVAPARVRVRGSRRGNDNSLVDWSVTGEQPVVITKLGHGSAAQEVSPSEAVRRVASLHGRLCEVVRSVDSSYGLPLVVVLVSILMHLIVATYYFIMDIITSRDQVHHMLLQFLWGLTHMLRLLLMVEPCHYTVAEGRRTRGLVCRLMSSASERPALGSLFSRVELFSRQLALQSVCYTPLGMCRLDRPLLVSVIGAVTTYLVILIQLET